MSKILSHSTIYNQMSNNLVIKLLSSLKIEQLTGECGGYFKSLESLFSHLSGGELFFINFIAKALPNLKIEEQEVKDLSFAKASEQIGQTSQMLVSLANSMTNEQLATQVDFFGQSISIEHLFHQAFVHSSHHRGQISQVLDQLGIEHDMILLTPK